MQYTVSARPGPPDGAVRGEGMTTAGREAGMEGGMYEICIVHVFCANFIKKKHHFPVAASCCAFSDCTHPHMA